MAELNVKQKKFADEYLIDLNATQAAIRAGYSTKTANEIGCENLTKPSIRAYIDIQLAEQSKRTGVNADRIVRELAKIAFVDASQIINFDSGGKLDQVSTDDTAVIASVKVKTIPTDDGEIVEREIKLHDKNKALELLGKRFGLFTEKIELSGKVDVEKVKDIEQRLFGSNKK